MRYAVIHKTSIVVESDCQSEYAVIVRQNSCWFIWLLLLNTALSWVQVLVRDYVFIFEKRSAKNVLIGYNNTHLHMKETPNYQKLCIVLLTFPRKQTLQQMTDTMLHTLQSIFFFLVRKRIISFGSNVMLEESCRIDHCWQWLSEAFK